MTRDGSRDGELLPEARSHRVARAPVTGFFAATLGPRAALADFSAEALATLDSALARLETPEASSGGVQGPIILQPGNGATR